MKTKFFIITLIIALIIAAVIIFYYSVPRKEQVQQRLLESGIIEPRITNYLTFYAYTGFRMLPNGRKLYVKGTASVEPTINLRTE